MIRRWDKCWRIAPGCLGGAKFDRDRAVALISEGTVKGFFPTIQPTRRRR